MTQTRRLGVEGSKQRDVLIDAAEAILREEGYVGMSSQKVAVRAGLTKQLLYYYFRTMDDLILALVRRVNEHRQARFAAALDSAFPLEALWTLNSDPSGTALATELTAIASHREAVRAEIVTAARQFRARQVAAVAGLLARNGIEDTSAAAIVMVAGAIARTVNSEAALGLTEGHAEALALVGRVLAGLSSRPSRVAGRAPVIDLAAGAELSGRSAKGPAIRTAPARRERPMLVERSELTAKPGVEGDFGEALFGRVVPLLMGVDGVLSVQAGPGVENPLKFILLVGWQSLDAHTAYSGTPTAAEVRGIMRPFLSGGAMEHFELR